MAGAARHTTSPQQNSTEQPGVPRQSSGLGVGVGGGRASTCRVNSRARKSRTKQPPNISQLSCQLGNGNTPCSFQTIREIKGRCDCADNVIHSEPQTPSSTAFFPSLEYKQPDLPFIPTTSLCQDSCLLSWLNASNKAGNFTLVIPVWRACSHRGQRSRGGGRTRHYFRNWLLCKGHLQRFPAFLELCSILVLSQGVKLQRWKRSSRHGKDLGI